MRAGHGGIGRVVVEQALGLAHDGRRVGADKFRCARRDPLGALGRVAHDQHRLAQRRRLFLHPAAVGQHQVADIEQPREVRIVERFDQRDIVEAFELGIHDRADIGVEVHGKDNRHIITRRNLLNRFGDILHAVTEILAPVAGHADDALARKAALEFCQPAGQGRIALHLLRDPVKGIDDRVAGDMHAGRIGVLAQQGGAGRFGGRTMERGEAADHPAVHLFGPGMVDIAAP